MKQFVIFLVLAISFMGCHQKEADKNKQKVTVFIIGDSTVKNGQGDGAGGLWGWGDAIGQYFDTTKTIVENHALGGTSSRTYRDKGLWEKVVQEIKPGDFVLMQFGHNDGGPINDTIRARGTIKGIGEESETIDNLLTGKHEIVHTYGWYIKQYIKEAKEKGAIPIVISPIPRNDWVDGKVPRNDQSYGKWAEEVAALENVVFINLNDKMARAMEQLGENEVTGVYFFERDHTHTSAKGAVMAASMVVEGIQESSSNGLGLLLLDEPDIHFPFKQNPYASSNE